MRVFLIAIVLLAGIGVGGFFYLASLANAAAPEPATERVELDVQLPR